MLQIYSTYPIFFTGTTGALQIDRILHVSSLNCWPWLLSSLAAGGEFPTLPRTTHLAWQQRQRTLETQARKSQIHTLAGDRSRTCTVLQWASLWDLFDLSTRQSAVLWLYSILRHKMNWHVHQNIWQIALWCQNTSRFFNIVISNLKTCAWSSTLYAFQL